jgi:hypothetical protein
MVRKNWNKKGQVFQQLSALATGIATLAIILTVAFLVMAEGKSQAAILECENTSDASGIATCGEAYNATSELQGAVDDIPGWVPLVVVASIGAILLGLVALFRRK